MLPEPLQRELEGLAVCGVPGLSGPAGDVVGYVRREGAGAGLRGGMPPELRRLLIVVAVAGVDALRSWLASLQTEGGTARGVGVLTGLDPARMRAILETLLKVLPYLLPLLG